MLPSMIEVRDYGFVVGKTFYLTHNAGLFSILSTVYQELLELQRPVRRISSRFGADLYKKFPLQNIWPALFQEPKVAHSVERTDAIKRMPPAVDWWNVDYSQLPISDVSASIRTHFESSKKIGKIKQYLLEKYGINPSEIIAVHYRGTDKSLETATISVERFVEEIDAAIKEFPKSRVLLQVDEMDVLNYFMSRYKSRAFYFQELPPSRTNNGSHFEHRDDSLGYGLNFLAAVEIIAGCRTVITHTGNGALWELIFRGSADHFTQLR